MITIHPARAHGFTLIELLITLAILGLLASLALPVSRTIIQRNQERELRFSLHEIRAGIDSYKKASDEGRIAKSIGDRGYPPSLDAMVRGVVDTTDLKQKKIYFLRRIPRDPMNPDESIPAEKTWGLRASDSDADSPHDGYDVFDVYSTSPKIGLNGAPYNQW